MTTRPRSVTGPLACLLATLVLVGAALVAAPAATAASWTTVMSMHGAEIQVCKVPLDKGWKLKARLVSDSGHGHRAGVTARGDDGQVNDSVTFRVRGPADQQGQVARGASPARSLRPACPRTTTEAGAGGELHPSGSVSAPC